jgi:hypothetical protein
MEKFIKEATDETPTIILDGDKGFFSFTGKSYPENVTDFYKPVFEYIEIYKQNPQTKTTIEFSWLYYNTSTSKNIIKIIMSLKDVSPEFEVRWICKKNFDLIIEKGEEIRDVLNINMKIITI